MKTFINLLLLLIFITTSAYAQEVISANGSTASTTQATVSYTIGEPVITTVSDANTTLTQGFHQSKLTITAINGLTQSNFEIKVYPNPTQDFVIVHFNKLNGQPAYSLYNLNGKLLGHSNITQTDVKINMTTFAEGAYLLKLFDNKQMQLQTFKIIKH